MRRRAIRQLIGWGATVGLLAGLAGCAAPAPASAPTSLAAASAQPPAAVAAPAPAGAAMAAGSGTAHPLAPPVTVKAANYALSGYVGFFVALERGYFREEGLELDLVEVRNTPDQMPPLATGELHIGAGTPTPAIFNAVARDIGLKIVGANAVVTPQDRVAGFLIRKDLVDSGRFSGPRDFRGTTVALPPGGGLHHYYLDRLLESAGLTREEVNVTSMVFPDMLPALANRALDSAFTAQPFLSLSIRQGTGDLYITNGEIVPGLPSLVMLMSPVFAREEPEAARRYVTAQLRSLRDFWRAFKKDEASQGEIIDILTRHLPIKDPAILAETLRFSVLPNGELNEGPLETAQDYFLRVGTQQQRVDLSRVIDRSYMDYAVERLGRVE